MRGIQIAACLVFSILLIGCGEPEAPSDEGPRAQRNVHTRPIQRELRQLRARPPAEVAPGPVAAAEPAEAEVAAEIETEAGATELVGAATESEETEDVPGAGPIAGLAASPRLPVGEPEAEDSVVETAEEAAEAAHEAVVAVVESAPAEVAPAAASEVVDTLDPELPVELTRVIIAEGVEDHEPFGPAPFESIPERVYVFIEAANRGTRARTLRVSWTGPDGAHARPVDLDVPVSRRWRTWATTQRVTPGAWTVVVRDEDGEERARTTFVIPAAADTQV